MKLYVLTTGTMWVEKGFFEHFGTSNETGRDYVAQPLRLRSCQYFIDHSEAKIIFDLGYRAEDFEKYKSFPHRQGPDGIYFKQQSDETPERQLEKIGITIDDIDYVVISHLMLEHAGWLPLFQKKKAQIIVQRRELEYAYVNSRWDDAPVPFHSWMYFKEHFDLPGLKYKLLDGDYPIAENVKILYAPGHTPGYQMIHLQLEKTGAVILSACETRNMYYGIGINALSQGIPHAFTYYAGEELRTFRRILGIVNSEKGQIFCGHDAEQYDNLKKPPEYYD